MKANENNEIFTKDEKEYKRLDKLYALTRELFTALKGLEEIGAYGSEKWAETWKKYAETFKKVHGYNPHWAR